MRNVKFRKESKLPSLEQLIIDGIVTLKNVLKGCNPKGVTEMIQLL